MNPRRRPTTAFRLMSSVFWLSVGMSLSTLVDGLSAADWQPQPGYNWTGPYIGAGAEYQTLSSLTTFGTGNSSQTATPGADAFLPTIHAGYNWQIPSGFGAGTLVVGLDGDVGISNSKKANIVVLGTETFNESLSNPWQGSFRGRLGVPLGPSWTVMLYGTGGIAFGEFESTTTVTGPASGTLKGTSTRAAWTVGGGVELGLTRDWSWNVEYIYIDTGSITDTAVGSGLSVNTGRISGNVVRSGVSWHF